MRVWLYYRLSRDEDEELNSLMNQRSIIESYALSHGHTIVGESCDDNISGMHFDRDGIEQLTEVVDAGLIDAVIVKDLSRLGRHRTQTALYIDYLRKHHVRVLSATENIDTFNEADDLVIGFKGLMNDYYARDGSRRVTTGYRQKQKAGLVITPPFGYFKDKNTNQVEIVPEAAETIHLIFASYLSGMGLKAIARLLNEEKRKTPAQMQMALLGKRMPERLEAEIKKKYLWDGTMVGRLLKDEAYTGTLICHKSERNKINKTFRFTEAAEQFRHENYLPPIITREMWDAMQDTVNRWTPKATNTLAQLKKLRQQIEATEEEMEDILMERIRDKANAQRYDRMIAKREEQIDQAKKKIAELENLGQTIRSRQAKLRKDISLIDQILADGRMTEAHLRLLIEKILVYETEGGLRLEIKVKAPFQNHTDTYENGVLTNSELEEIIKAG